MSVSPSDLAVLGNRAHYRPFGVVSAAELADMLADAIQVCRQNNLREVVLDIRELTGFESPGPAYRRWVVKRWGECASPEMRIALIARDEHVCPKKTGMIIAAEIGLKAHICLTDNDASKFLAGT